MNRNFTARNVCEIYDYFDDYADDLLERQYTTESYDFKLAMTKFKHGIEGLGESLNEINSVYDSLDKRTNAYKEIKMKKGYLLQTLKLLNDRLIEIVNHAH